MLIRKTFSLLWFLTLLFCFFSCDKEAPSSITAIPETTDKEKEAESEEGIEYEKHGDVSKGVCVFEGLGVFEEVPLDKWLYSLAYGEEVTYLGKRVKIENAYYSRIMDKTGKEGWTSTWYLVENAKAGVVIKRAEKHRTPDPQSFLGHFFEPLTLVGIKIGSNVGNFIEVTDFQNYDDNTVWILKDTVITDKNELTLLRLYVIAKNHEDSKNKITALLQNEKYKNTTVMGILKDIYADTSTESETSTENPDTGSNDTKTDKTTNP